jgi:hypothetical protein
VFEETVRLEMDLRMEAAAAAELAANFADDPTYHVPAVDWQRTSRRVMTQERVGGTPLDDREALLAAGHDLTEVLTKAAAVFFKQVFRDGFFHGDQHPGNMSVDAEGNIVAVDFGIMGRLDRRTRYYLADMLLATLARDYHLLAEVHVEAGFLPPGQPPDVFAQALRSVCEPIFGRSLNQISFARLLAQLFQLTESFDMAGKPGAGGAVARRRPGPGRQPPAPAPAAVRRRARLGRDRQQRPAPAPGLGQKPRTPRRGGRAAGHVGRGRGPGGGPRGPVVRPARDRRAARIAEILKTCSARARPRLSDGNVHPTLFTAPDREIGQHRK